MVNRLINSNQWCLLTGTLARGISHERCLHRRRRAHGRGPQSGPAVRLASGRSRRQGSRCAGGAHACRPGADRRRHHGLRQPGRRAGRQRRAQRSARLEAAGERAGHERRPAVRLVAAGAALRRAGGDVRRDGRGDRRRRREHEPRADGPVLAAAGEERLRHAEEPEDGGALSRHPVQPVHGRRDDGEEVRPVEGRARRVRVQQPSARHRRHAERRVREGSAADRDHAAGRQEGACIASTKAFASTPASKRFAA